jgi:hypothetical protein
MSLSSGLFGNYSQVSAQELQQQYGANNLQTASYGFEFSRKFNIQPFYVALVSLAYENKRRING